MKLELPPLRQTPNAAGGEVRAEWVGATSIEIDEARYFELIARATATAMGQNLYQGRRPDGSAPMPARKRDGQPRGLGAAVARAIAAVQTGRMAYLIAAHREQVGHMGRILQGIPFRPPPLGFIGEAVHRAFLAAVRVGEALGAGRALRLAGASRAELREAAAYTRGLRSEFGSALSAIGAGARTQLAKRFRSAGRAHIRRSGRR